MSSNFTCESCGIELSSVDARRKHRHQKHSKPLPFESGGLQYVVGVQDGLYVCPFNGCGKQFSRRDRINAHLETLHSVSKAPWDGEGSGGAVALINKKAVVSSVNGNGSVCTEITDAVGGENAAAHGETSPAIPTAAQNEKLRHPHRMANASAGAFEYGISYDLSSLTEPPKDAAGSTAEAWMDGSVGEGENMPAENNQKSAVADRVRLVPGKNYLEGGSLLDALGIWLHTGLRVFLCRECKIVLTLKTVAGHLRERHMRRMNSQEQADICQLSAARGVYSLAAEVPIPLPGGPPVQGIPVFEGHSCTATPQCMYSVRDLNVLAKHGRVEHRLQILTDVRYRTATVQALFATTHRVFFEVDASLTPSSDLDMRSYLKSHFLPGIEAPLVIPQNGDRDRPPLLKITGWDTFFEEIRTSADQRKLAQLLKAKHTALEHGGIFVRLEQAQKHLHEKLRHRLDNHPQSPTVRKVLLHGKPVPIDAKPFNFVSSSNENYDASYLQMVRAMIRIQLGHELGLSFNFSTVQSARLQTLIDALQDLGLSPAGLLVNDVFAYHRFCWSLISYDESQADEPWGNPLQRYLWLKALRPDGKFMDASDLTPELARLKYFCYITTLYRACFYESKDKEGESDIDRTARFHDVVLSLGSPTTFNMLFELQQAASSLAHCEAHEPNVYVDPNYASITIGTETLHLDQLRAGMQTLLKRVKNGFVRLSREDWPAWDSLNVVDQMTEDSWGYSFLEEDSFKIKQKNFFLDMVDRHQLAHLDGDLFSWDQNAIRTFLRQAEEIWGHMRHALYVGVQLANRVAQFLQHQIRNSDRARNLIFQGTEALLISRYSKTTNLRGKDVCIPAFLAAPLREALLVLLGSGLRESEAILAGIVHGDKSREIYRTYLCVREGERITEEYFYDELKRRNKEVFNCAWGARDFRQGMITLGREFISPNETFPCADDVLAAGADHSTEIDHTHYASVHGELPNLTHNKLWQQRWLSQEWSSLLGMGPNAPPEPVRALKIRSRAQANPFPDNLIDDLCIKISDSIFGRLRDEGLMFRADANNLAGPSCNSAEVAVQTSPLLATRPVPRINPHDSFSDSAFATTPSLNQETLRRRASSPYSPNNAETGIPSFARPLPGAQLMRLRPTADPEPLDLLHSTAIPLHGSSSAPPFSPEPRISLSPNAVQPRAPPRLIQTNPTSLPHLLVPSQSGNLPPSSERKRSRDPLVVDGEDQMPPAKRFNTTLAADRPASIFDFDVELDTSDHEFQNDFGPSGLSSHEEDSALVDNIRAAMSRVVGTTDAREKSPQQLEAILEILRGGQDLIVTLPTGGGKSMLWLAPVLVNPALKFIVVCPFVVLLNQQHARATAAGIKCLNFSESKAIFPEVQIVFVQVENVANASLARALSAKASIKFDRIFIDEHHDRIVCPQDRTDPWDRLANNTSAMGVPIVLLSATCPPRLREELTKPYQLLPSETNEIRSSTDRPELGFHSIYLPPKYAEKGFEELAFALNSTLTLKERMLVFFATVETAETFALRFGWTLFHSSLSERQKSLNLHLWEIGRSPIMACTTAFAQGVDYSHVRYVLVYEPTFSLLQVVQMAGRAGRDGRESHVFFITLAKTGSRNRTNDSRMMFELGQVVHDRTCRVFNITKHMDGEDLAVDCRARQGGTPCDVCDPNSPIQKLIAATMEKHHIPFSVDGNPPPPNVGSSKLPQRSTNVPSTSTGFVSAKTVLEAASSSQDSEAAYWSKVDDINLGQELSADVAIIPGPSKSRTLAFKPTGTRYEGSSQPFLVYSLPPTSGPIARAHRARQTEDSLLQRTAALDRFLPPLRGKCPYHFALEGKLADDHYPCPLRNRLPHHQDYQQYRLKFDFRRYNYCYRCSIPQNRGSRKLEPQEHQRNWTGDNCDFAHFIYRVVFAIWQVPAMKDQFMEELAVNDSIDDVEAFGAWAAREEANSGRYHNCLEVFLWYCRLVQSSNPWLFSITD